MTEVVDRYVEQLSTTAETLRRRFVSYYDGIFIVGQRVSLAAERSRDFLEPASYDLRDHVKTCMAQTEPISQLNKEWKNTLVETYLGCSVLMTGLSYGQMAGSYSLAGILDRIFSGYVEFSLLLLIPVYTLLCIRKSAG